MDTLRSAAGYIMGPGLIPQLLLTVLVLLVFYTLITLIETVVDAFKKYSRLSAVLLEDTYTGSQYIPQSPDTDYPLLYPSSNEVNGMEFTYSFHLFVNPESFSKESTKTQCGGVESARDTTSLRHIFHRGNKNAWPVMAPGVFLHGDVNTIRIYLNSSTSWDNHVDIPNIPVGKWFHMVITQKGKYMDIYINGNVTVRHEFKTIPRLNFGPIRVLNDITFPTGTNPRNTGDIKIDGAMKGMISRLKYYAFALNYSQIDALYREAPSKKIVSPSFSQAPPYFHDDWWVTRY